MAAGDILIRAGTTITFGTDVAWTTRTSVSSGAGSQSAQRDLGDESTTPRTNLYRVRFYVQCSTQPTVGQSIDIYFKTSDDPSLHSDNDVGNGDLAYGAGLSNKLKNLTYIGSAIVDEALAATEFVLSVNEVVLNSRYLNVVMWNTSGGTTSATAGDIALELTPIIYQGQSS